LAAAFGAALVAGLGTAAAATPLISFSDVMNPYFFSTAFCLAIPLETFCVALTRSFCGGKEKVGDDPWSRHVMAYLKTELVGVVQAGLDLSLGFQGADDVSVLPADFVSDASNLAVLAVRAETQDLHGEWDTHALLLVVRWWNAFKDLQAGESDLSTAGLVWDHA
jgi:hypothetical protein